MAWRHKKRNRKKKVGQWYNMVITQHSYLLKGAKSLTKNTIRINKTWQHKTMKQKLETVCIQNKWNYFQVAYDYTKASNLRKG